MIDKSITFCVDTNIFVEFKPLDQIPWSEIAPSTARIHVVVPTKVGEELDDHKKKIGRLRRRGIEFSQIARVIEKSSDGRAVLRESNPEVTIEFTPIYRRSQLDGDLYDLDDKDGRIVAEVARFMQDHPNTIFLSDDSKPLRWARETGLQWRRPPESWRREEGPDERDREILELKRELGAQPAFSITFPDAVTDRREYVLEPAPIISCAKCSAQLVEAFLSVNPKVPREDSIARYGLAQPDPFGIPSLTFPHNKLTESDLDRYEREYAKFEERVRWCAEHLFSALGRLLPVNVQVTNDGNRAGDRVLVELELGGGFHFVPRDSVANLVNRCLEPPSAPEPNIWRIMPPNPKLEPPEPRQPHVFYLLDEPKADGSTTRIQWRCEEFRQGQSFILPAIVCATREAARGALKVCLSSAVMAKTVEATTPLICLEKNTERTKLCTYLEGRSSLLPSRYDEAVQRTLRVSSKRCAGGSPPGKESAGQA